MALDCYYNNSSKIVAACMEEIKVLPDIKVGDYKALVLYKTCIIDNLAWLSVAELENEVSNRDMMQKLMVKLLWGQVEKWSEYFEEQGEESKARQFELFLRWLEKAGRAWETVVAFGV